MINRSFRHPKMYKTIKCYYVISYKTLFWDYMSTFYSPSERRKKGHLSVRLVIEGMIIRGSPPAESLLCHLAMLTTGLTYANRKSSQHYRTIVDVDVKLKKQTKKKLEKNNINVRQESNPLPHAYEPVILTTRSQSLV